MWFPVIYVCVSLTQCVFIEDTTHPKGFWTKTDCEHRLLAMKQMIVERRIPRRWGRAYCRRGKGIDT